MGGRYSGVCPGMMQGADVACRATMLATRGDRSKLTHRQPKSGRSVITVQGSKAAVPLAPTSGHLAYGYRSRMSKAEAKLRDAVERSYKVFANIPPPSKLEASPLRDGSKILRTLTSVPLRQLGGEQVGPYSSWAITTVGSGQDYRHFLPRIFELAVTDPVWLGAEPPIMASRLNMAKWRVWSVEQQGAIRNFFNSAFDAVVERVPGNESAGSWLCGIVTLGEPASPAFERWRSSRSPNAALHLASFIEEQEINLRNHAQVGAYFLADVSEDARREVAKLLLEEQTTVMLQWATGQASDEDRSYFLDPALAALLRQF
jgi:hypothetical protein